MSENDWKKPTDEVIEANIIETCVDADEIMATFGYALVCAWRGDVPEWPIRGLVRKCVQRAFAERKQALKRRDAEIP